MDVYRGRSEEVELGMTMLGLVFSSMCYGITLAQTYIYCKRFPRDPFSIKLLVAIIAALDTVSAALITHASWFYLVTTGSIGLSVWSLNAELALSMVISGFVETFLIYRVWMLSGHRHALTLVLLSLTLLHLVSGEFSAAAFFQLQDFSKFGSVKIPSILRLGSAACCDTGIAVSLCYFLQKKRTGYKKTDKIIDHLIIFSINSGLLTSVSSVACLITYLIVPKTWVYLALCFLISRLYANTFLSSLNSRQILRHDLDTSGSDEDTPPVPRFRSMGQNIFRGSPIDTSEKSRPHINVFVTKETVTQSDTQNSKNKTTSVEFPA